MGLGETAEQKKFTELDLLNKDLIIKMLQYEDTLIHGEVGKKIYTDDLMLPRRSLTPEWTIHRLVLAKFGFSTDDEDVLNYRKIFLTYYNSPTDYDKDVLKSVTYMRENKCVYYTAPDINIGDSYPDCEVYKLDGKTKTTILKELGKFKYAVIGAFSNS